jgi:hypothetical protein
MSSTRFAALALAATALAVSGCGGSSKPNSSTTAAATTTTATTAASTALPPATVLKVATGTPLTHAQLIAKADEICGRTNVKRAAIVTTSRAQFGQAMPQVAIYDATESAELSKLVPPQALRHDWGLILGDLQLYTQYTNAVAGYARTNKLNSAAPLIETAERIHLRMASIAERDGVVRCAHFK